MISEQELVELAQQAGQLVATSKKQGLTPESRAAAEKALAALILVCDLDQSEELNEKGLEFVMAELQNARGELFAGISTGEYEC